jgi:dolichol-phosphate mannosyltransferase
VREDQGPRDQTLTISLVIPCRDEEGGLRDTVVELERTLTANQIPHEILAINDHSTDASETILEDLARQYPTFRWMHNERKPGFGRTVQTGLLNFEGDAVCIMMADGSDDPADVLKYYRALLDGHECVFGSRFLRGSEVRDYPKHKMVLNRLANWFIMLLFGFRYNDTTNAFKCYRREVIEAVQPILSAHFNLTVELPLKAIVRGYSYTVIPISWRGRVTGVSKLKIKEMGSRYLFIVLYVLLERVLARGDYYRMAGGEPAHDKTIDRTIA